MRSRHLAPLSYVRAQRTILVAACLAAACQNPPPAGAPFGEPSAPEGMQSAPPDWLGCPPAAGELAYRVDFTRRAGAEGPRMAEIAVQTSADLAFASSLALDAATRAGKQVIVQQGASGRLRVVVFSSGNVDRLDTGPLACLRFRPVASGAAHASIDYDGSQFAPSIHVPDESTLALERMEVAP